jgi:hypothetical protein
MDQRTMVLSCVPFFVRSLWLKLGAKFCVCCLEVFGEDTGVVDGCHEVGVAGPAWEHVDVHVVRDAGARGDPEVHAHVEACRRISLTQSGLRPFRKVHQFIRDLFRHRIELTRVQVRNDHQMSSDVRVKIQENEPVLAAVKYEVSLVVLGVVRNAAQNTALGL